MDFKSENMLSKWLQATRKEFNDDEGFKAFVKTIDFKIKLDPEKIEELSGFNKVPDFKDDTWKVALIKKIGLKISNYSGPKFEDLSWVLKTVAQLIAVPNETFKNEVDVFRIVTVPYLLEEDISDILGYEFSFSGDTKEVKNEKNTKRKG